MDIFRKLEAAAKRKKKTIILPESYDPRVIEAAKVILKKKLAKLILIDTGRNIRLPESDDLDIIDIEFSVQFAKEYKRLRSKKIKGFTLADAEKALNDPLLFACMLLKNKYADAVVAGSVYSTGNVLRSAMQTVGLSKGNKTVSSFFLMSFPKAHKMAGRVFAYGDCGVLPNPDAEQLSDIAIQTSLNFKKLTGIKPRTAFLSFSTKGSAKDASTEKVIRAMHITRRRMPGLICDGEMQFDSAFVPAIARRKDPNGKIKGDANVFIFPDLNAGNIAYKITERIGGAVATGPIVQGLALPVMDLSRGCNTNDIVNMSIIASLY
ncbi:MAG TPA: phosphate acetyltransferase [Ignavibacteria bacterium]|nr:phosphate acetyltransferase [Ignavibacteria bacterium]HMQ99629.1 phosphate acetyltransferase [Ignavibacteria bacterium]